MGQIQTILEQSQGDPLDSITIVDGGQIVSHGIYGKDSQDYDMRIVKRLIIHRKLAPFYKGYGDAQDMIIAFSQSTADIGQVSLPPIEQDKESGIKQNIMSMFGLSSAVQSSRSNERRRSSLKQQQTKKLTKSNTMNNLPHYNNDNDSQRQKVLFESLCRPLECPICFLFYPSNINFTRCCSQPICTECFLQIKRSDDGKSPKCPYCVEQDFGVYYSIEPAGRNASKTLNRIDAINKSKDSMLKSQSAFLDSPLKSKDKSALYDSSQNIVFSDDVRPQLVAKIKERERLAIQAAEDSERLARRLRHQQRRRRNRFGEIEITSPNYDYAQGLIELNDEIEELMLQEAMRLSLAEEEDRQRVLEREAYNQRIAQQNSSSTSNPPVSDLDNLSLNQLYSSNASSTSNVQSSSYSTNYQQQ